MTRRQDKEDVMGEGRPDIEHPWIVCARGHEVRALPLSNEGSMALQIRVGGVSTTTTILGPQARLALAEALTNAR